MKRLNSRPHGKTRPNAPFPNFSGSASANPASTGAGVLANDILKQLVPGLNSIQMPGGYYYKLAGEAQSEDDTFAGGFMTVVIATLFLFVVVLILQFKTFKGLLIVLSVIQLGVIRFLPVVLTSVTAICGLLPIGLDSNPLISPLALVLIGGLISSTILSRIVTPVVYRLLPPKIETIAGE